MPVAAPVRAGVGDPANAAAVIEAIEAATAAVVRGEAAAIVTNPIAKYVLKSADFPYPGHTEFLAALAERHFPGKRYRPVMMLASHELRVVPLTVHCPLAQVPKAITRALIFETARTTYAALKRDFGIASPRIAVAGLNPHAGEDGTMGTRGDRDHRAGHRRPARPRGCRSPGRTRPTRCSTPRRGAAMTRSSPCITTRR